VQRLRVALNDGDSHGRTDPDLQRDTLARLIDAEVRLASPRGIGVWHDVPEHRRRLAALDKEP
jgi:hypothetical protein